MIEPDRLIGRIPWLALVAGLSLVAPVEAGSASTAANPPSRMPAFTLFGWLSPPNAVADSSRIAELAEAGFNVMLPAYNDSGIAATNLARLDLAAAHGLACLIADERFLGLDPATPGGSALLDSIMAQYGDHPALLGWYLGDEPLPPWNLLPPLHAALKARDATRIPYNNLHGRQRFASHDAWIAYTQDFMASMQPQVLSNDQYDFLATRDRLQFTENAQGSMEKAQEAGIPWWAVIYLIEHAPYRAIGEGELRWQAAHALAHGARGIGYFSYWTPDPHPVLNWGDGIIGRDLQPSFWYPIVKALNRRLKLAGEILASSSWKVTGYTGSMPPYGGLFVTGVGLVDSVQGRAAIGSFQRNGREFLLVAASDSIAASSVRLVLRGAGIVHERSEGPVPRIEERPDDLVVSIDLAPGDFVLLEVEGSASEAGGLRIPPDLGILPNPAVSEVEFRVDYVRGIGTVVILDSSGRRVWSTSVPPGSSRRTWRGERDTGGTARAGIYFVRIEDDLGHSVRRFAWLGSR